MIFHPDLRKTRSRREIRDGGCQGCAVIHVCFGSTVHITGGDVLPHRGRVLFILSLSALLHMWDEGLKAEDLMVVMWNTVLSRSPLTNTDQVTQLVCRMNPGNESHAVI